MNVGDATGHEEGTSEVASVEEIRRYFPALARLHAGHPVAYFDGPGGTQVPRRVVEAMTDYLYHHNANTHWVYPTSVETDALLDDARQVMADFLGGAPREIAFGANMTTLTFHVARSLGRGWGPGDEVVVTELDHHANVAPWRALERERGITVRTVRMSTDSCSIDLGDLESAVGPATRLLAIGAASNAVGTITDVSAAASIAREHGALVFVDAVHFAPHALVDARALGADLIACSAYKFYGPHVGILWGRHDLLESLDVPKLDPSPDTSPERIETGTQNHEGIVGAAAAVEWLASLAGEHGTRRERLASTFRALHSRGEALLHRLRDGLGGIAGVTVYGPRRGQPRTPTVSFTVRGRAADDVASRLVSAGVFASSGDFYASTVVERLGLTDVGLVRAGCSCYTTAGEVDRLLSAVSEMSST